MEKEKWVEHLKKGNIFEVYGPMGMGIDYKKLTIYIQNLLDEKESEIIKRLENMKLLFSKNSNMWYKKGTGALYTNSDEIAKNENEVINNILKELNK